MPRWIAVLLLGVAALQAGPPTALAIRDARIVRVSGPVLERGTIVIRDGLIEAVGTDVNIPADAWVIEGKGLTVYPGLIDALSTIGLPASAVAEPPDRAPSRGSPPATPPSTPAPAAPPARGPEDRPSNTSWLRAADLLN
ncbi:MAG: amidohydrolase, partial [Bryobacteraceae bacterium]